MSDCLKCGRAVSDAYCCQICADSARKHLAHIADLTRYADEKRARIGSCHPSDTGGRTAEVPLPFDPRVSKVLNPIKIALHGTARVVLELAPEDVGDDTSPNAESLPSVADWLIQFTDWLRHQDFGAEEFDTFERASGNVLRLFDRPPDKLYVGQCRAEDDEGKLCPEMLYVEVNGRGEAESAVINCPRCKTQHDVGQRREQLWEALENYLATTKEISRMCRRLIDGDVSVRMLQIYAKHGFLIQQGERVEFDSMGRRRKVATYRIGDVKPAVDLWVDYLTEQRTKKRKRKAA